MKKIKSAASVFLVLVMILTCFTGCQSKEDNTTNLTNKRSTEATKNVYDYICNITGDGIISGQQETYKRSDPDFEMNYIYDASGKYPALRGLDFITSDYDEDADRTRFDDYQAVVDRATEWWNKGGLVTICWHWGAPPDTYGYEASKRSTDIDQLLTEGSDLYKSMIKDMDEIAVYLKKLQEAGVPVLWRPLHEFDGKWFWWGQGTPEQFVELWKIMYDRYTNYHKLNNLIWVLGYTSSVKADYYPGDEYVDIAGMDLYSTKLPVNGYKKVYEVVEDRKPICFHECETIPSPDELKEKEVNFVWFLNWHTNKLTECNTNEHIKEVYTSDYVVTLDELPDFNNYERASTTCTTPTTNDMKK